MPHPAPRHGTARRAARCAALLSATLVALPACRNALEPHEVAGRYVLQSVAGEPLPAVNSTSPDWTVRVLAETLVLRADRTGTATSRVEIEQPALPPGEQRVEQTWERDIRFRIRDGRVEIEFVCGPAQLCAAPPHLVGRRSGSALRVHYALGERVPRLYARVGVAP